MPNWVFNSLTIEGQPEIITQVKNQLNSPYTRMHDSWNKDTGSYEQKEYSYDNPVFSFWNIVKPTDLEAYNKQPDHSLPIQEAMLHKGDSWYDFNNREWGTKWDVGVSNDNEYSDTALINDEPNGENHVLVYSFNTAWSPPIPAIEKLSAQYPNLLMTLSYEEEQGWGGEMEFLRGEVISESEYGWKCRECDHTEDETPWCETCEFDMCPSCGYGEPNEENQSECDEHKEKVGA